MRKFSTVLFIAFFALYSVPAFFTAGGRDDGSSFIESAEASETISALGNPRVMIIVDDESGKNASVVEDELMRVFEKAGYLIVDRDQAQTLLALDPKKAFSDPELLAGAAKTIRADIIIVARASSGAAHTQRFGIHMYKPSASVQVKAVLTKTAYQISSSRVSRGSRDWRGTSYAGGMLQSATKQAAEEIIGKIASRMASVSPEDGKVTVNIKVSGASFKEIESITAYLKDIGQVFRRGYSQEMTELDFVSEKNADNVASLISDFSLPGGKIIEIDGLTSQTVSAKVKAQGKEEKKADIQYVVINIFLDKLNEDDAQKVEYELGKFIGSGGEVQGDYQNPVLRVNVKISQGSEGAKDVHAIASFLGTDMKKKGVELLIDSPEGNSIRGSTPDRWFW